MKKLFISYAREDRGRVEPLVSFLRDEGFEVFWDSAIPSGVEWPEFLEAQLGSAHALLVLWTPASVGSRWVRTEAHEALLQGKLMPLSLDDVRPPFAFRQIHAFDLIGWRGDPADPRLARLVAELQARPATASSTADDAEVDAEADHMPPDATPRPWPAAQAGADAEADADAETSWPHRRRWLAAGAVALALLVWGSWTRPGPELASPAPGPVVAPARPDLPASVPAEPDQPPPKPRPVSNAQRCDAINQQLSMGMPVPEADRAFLRNGCR